MMKNCFNYFLLFFSLIFLVGCEYKHVVHNTTGAPIYNVSVYSKSLSFNHGVISSNSFSSFLGDIKFSPLKDPRISWNTENGEEHLADVSLSRWPWLIYETHFVISEQGVTAHFFPVSRASKKRREFLAEIREKGEKDKGVSP